MVPELRFTWSGESTVAVGLLLSIREPAPSPLGPPDRSAASPMPTADAATIGIARGFVEAYGSFDAEQAIGYLVVTRKSIGLWEQHAEGYEKQVKAGTAE
jgi:hypothetical protein